MTASEQYLDTLLQYYEEEVSGEAYFRGLEQHFDETEKLSLLADVEAHAARSVEPLIARYQLTPRPAETLCRKGREHVARHAALDWGEFVKYMADQYPAYLDEFAALERMAPEADRDQLKTLTAHEVATIEFAKLELAGDADSCAPLTRYLQT